VAKLSGPGPEVPLVSLGKYLRNLAIGALRARCGTNIASGIRWASRDYASALSSLRFTT
jgi:hypothetical protein